MASGLENIETIESPFRRFVTTIGVFPTAFTDAMTYYECLAYLVKYLEDSVVPAVNENAEALKELQDYVVHYFDNLDVQDEINNKLDQMAEDGTLQEIITAYIQANVAWVFDNVADMQSATNLVSGSYARTLGYTTKGDGGGAYYSISDTSQTGAIALANDLYAIFTPVSNLVYSVESFAGSTPEEKLFNALDTVTEGVILAGKVEITHQYTAQAKDYRKITILGATIKLNTQMWFVQANATYKTVPAFKNCNIVGLNNKFFDDSTACVGMLFDSCNIKATIMYYGNYYVQSPYFLNCTFESQDRLLYTPQIYDFKMVGCRVESATETLVEVTNQGIMQGAVDNCLVEGRTNVVFKFTACYSFSITNCYFENNNGGIVQQTGSNAACYLNFKDNWINGTMTGTDYVISIASSGYNSARISNNISNIDTGKYICNRYYFPLPYVSNLNINYAHPWKGSGYVPQGNRWQTINGTNKTATWDADNSAWVCTYQIPYAEAYTELHPIYLYFAGSYGSANNYQGFAIVRVDLSTVYTGGAIKAYGETTIIAGRNHGLGTPHDITASVTLSNDANNATDILVTVKLTGFTNNRGKYRFLDPFTILGIDQEK